jgi:hypothetical protein
LKKLSLRKPIGVEERLVITFRFLATGTSFRQLSFNFRIGISTASRIVRETCDAIYSALRRDYLVTPRTEAEWRVIETGFWNRWNCPNTLGGLEVFKQC